MSKIGIFFGSTTGNTETIAQRIQEELGNDVVDLHNVDAADAGKLSDYEKLILATSTWGVGDLQDDFEAFLPQLQQQDFSGKKVALFGLGDSAGYPESFVDGIGEIYETVTEKGGTVVAKVPTEGYTYDASRAEVDGEFVGLPLDIDSEDEKTDERLTTWIEKLKAELLTA